ncbi:MAG: ATP-binding protein [Deltaproteobacteria bacterium]|nr:MAG: ATP-binding protein [Deltaproteobacteria bacterium]
MSETAPSPLPAELLRWTCNPENLGFATTSDVEPLRGVVGQPMAVEALRFGLETDAPGHNVFVRGLIGTGRLTLVRDFLRSMEDRGPDAPDRVFVHNFQAPDRPRLITLPRGRASAFSEEMQRLVRFIEKELPSRVHGEAGRRIEAALQERAEQELSEFSDPLEARLAEQGLALALHQTDDESPPRAIVVPMLDDEALGPEEVKQALLDERLTEADLERLQAAADELNDEVEQFNAQALAVGTRHRERMREAMQELARKALKEIVPGVKASFPEAASHLDALVEDVVTRRLDDLEEPDFTLLYDANLLVAQGDGVRRPVILDHAPSVSSLLGTLDPVVLPDGRTHAPHMGVHGGALVRADGGTLVLDARDLATTPGAWQALTRTLRSGCVELRPGDGESTGGRTPSLKPDPIPVDVKVVLLGEYDVYEALDSADPDFPHLFKVLVDFDDVLPRDDAGVAMYAGVLARIFQDERLPPLTAAAVAAIAEHGARIASRPDALTSRFGRIVDIAREALWVARQAGQDLIDADHVLEAIRRTKERAGLPGRQFRERLRRGSLRIETSGHRIGQINGLAVTQAGQLTYGFPSRITASIGPGSQGTVNIQGEAKMSGPIHNKAFHILRGALRSLLPTQHPLSFDASVAFEQSYGGIDGDSASAGQALALISALSGVPLDQGIAITGALDQRGQILPVGAVNEKIEGFFDACAARGLTGTQGCVLPATNASELVLRPDVVQACREGAFAVWPVDSLHQALALLTGLDPGTLSERGAYAPGTVLFRAMAGARRLWQQGQS